MKVLSLFALGLIAATTAQAAQVEVTATGTVLFSAIGDPPLGAVGSGETATVSFIVDSEVFVDGIPGDVRGYEIDPATFMLEFESLTIGLMDPLADPAYFGIIDGFPVSDGFFVSTSPVSPGGVPLAQEPFNFNLDLGYEGDTLASLDILDAVGTYAFDGLTRFGMTLWAVFPDNVAMEMDFAEMTITEIVATPTEDVNWSEVKSEF